MPTKDSPQRGRSIAIYPGSFDPIHNGHIDVIRRATVLFDDVIVAVAYNPHKDSALFTADERVEMINESLQDIEIGSRARGDKFAGLTVDYALRVGARAIIRSLRAVTDFDYELQMTAMNRLMQPDVETIFLFADPKLFFSASRLIKEVTGYGRRVPELITESVMNKMRAKLGVA